MVVRPVPDIGIVSLDPGAVPVGPAVAVPFVSGYGAVPDPDVSADEGALGDSVSSPDEAAEVPVGKGMTVEFGMLVTDKPDIVPEPAVPLGLVAVEFDRGNGALEALGIVEVSPTLE